jgi:dTDP-4-dehydrorhamnose reductase
MSGGNLKSQIPNLELRIAVVGAGGQLGHDLVPALAARGAEVVPLARAELDVSDAAQMSDAARVKGALAGAAVVVNLAAMTRVDDCEEELDEAYAVNAVAAGRLAAVTRETGARLLHVSTDYVFDGGKREPYFETDVPQPVSAYGASKLAGEHLVRSRNPRHWIVRVSGLYGVAGSKGKGGNFVEAIIRRARSEGRVRVVDDQTTAPTFTAHLAAELAELIGRAPECGTYHLAADGETTWCDFAREIINQTGIDAEVTPIKSGELALRAARPAYSVLRSLTLKPLPHWRDGLRDYLAARSLKTEQKED